MPLNEESVKAKLVLPLLRSLGVEEDEIELETTFSIQLGRGVYAIKGGEVQRATGRLDLLCRRNGRPLFVIELKAEGEELTDTDRQQGLSYARLIEPMAPWVLLSNGRQTKIYDTVSGEPTTELDRTRLGGLSPDLDSELTLRFEALDHFIGYSLENLLAFCRSHNEALLIKFRADADEHPEAQLQKKYLPTVYVARNDIEDHFRDFIATGSASVFAIVGDSGTGKTNLLCHLLEERAEKPALYYSGSLLGPSIFREMALDFNLAFSPQDLILVVARKISALSERHGEPFLLFLDAVDEWEAPDKLHQLNDLAKMCRRFRMKLVVACKKEVWNALLSRNGLPTTLADAIHKGVPELRDFDRVEFEAAIHNYSRLLGVPEVSAIEVQRFANPLTLRIAFEVAYRDHVPLDVSCASRSTLARYLALKLGLTGSYERRILAAASEALLNRGKVQILEEELRADLNLRVSEELPQALFIQNILYRYIDGDGVATIGFYFSLIRDYSVAVYALKIDHLTGSERMEATRRALASYVGQSALIYFLRTGSEQDLKLCTEVLIELDLETGEGVMPRLLSWYGRSLEHITEYQDRIFGLLKSTLQSRLINSVLAREIVEVIRLWPPSEAVESLLVDIFDILSQSSAASLISHEVAALLSYYQSSCHTKRLVDLALDSSRDGYVRRYIVACLSSRPIRGREGIFVHLLVDPDPNVRMYVRSWYLKIETRDLREKLLQIFDNTLDSSVRADIALTLGQSALAGTGERLFHRWSRGDFDEHLCSWIARSIASLNYRPAIPEFIRLLRGNPYSKLSEHLLLALGELRAKEAVPVVLELIQEGDTRLVADWVLYVINPAAVASDYKKIEELTRTSLNPYTRFLGALILANGGNSKQRALVRSFISDGSVTNERRIRVLQTWGDRMLGVKMLGLRKKRGRKGQPVIQADLDLLYKILEEGSSLSAVALSLLMSLDTNSDRVGHGIKKFFPLLRVEFSGKTAGVNIDTLDKLAPIIRPWLNAEISSSRINALYASNCLELIDLLGDLSSLDVLNANRSRLESVLPKEQLDYVEETLRRRHSGLIGLGPRW